MKTITIPATNPYDVIIDKDVLAQSGKLIQEIHSPCKAAVITDANIQHLYATLVLDSLAEQGFEPLLLTIEPTETSKNMQTVLNALKCMAQNHFNKADLIVALGGGVVSDIAGLTASLYMRGIAYVNIPTSFVSAIDASIGGKTGVNMQEGKNLIATIWQPVRVICDLSAFDTLPRECILEGRSEAIKYAIVADASLLDILTQPNYTDHIEEIIERCIQIKQTLLSIDEQGQKERLLLGFGHTFAHSIEVNTRYTIPHGLAVSIGMALAAKISLIKGIASPDVYTTILTALQQADLPVQCPFTSAQLFEPIKNDTKRFGNTITLVLAKAIGNCTLVDVNINEVYALLVQALEESKY